MEIGLNQLILTRQRSDSSRVHASLPSISSCPARCSARFPSLSWDPSPTWSHTIALWSVIHARPRSTKFIYRDRDCCSIIYTLRSAHPPARPSVISHHPDISVRNTAHHRKITLLLLQTVPERYQKVYEHMLLVAEWVYVGNETTEELAWCAWEIVLIGEGTCWTTCFSSSCFNHDISYLRSREDAMSLLDPLSLVWCDKAVFGESIRRRRIVSLTSDPI